MDDPRANESSPARGVLRCVCVSEVKGTPKRAVNRAVVLADHGIEGDVHAGSWHRQISLLDEADVETMRAQGLDLEPGAFGENLLVAGLDLSVLGIGSVVEIGAVAVEVTQRGKTCHSRCAIYEAAGDCIMPRSGLFARVLRGGAITAGLPVRVDRLIPFETTQAAVLTVSDRCARGEALDTAGPAVARRVEEELGARVGWTGIVPDDTEAITDRLRDLGDRGLDLLLTAGGTGCGPRDVTPEATRSLLDREVPGLAEAMRIASSAVTPHAWLQRGVSGIYRRSLIVNLPGSAKAAVENLEAILHAIPHAIRLLRGDTAH